jgi:chaperonin GroES
MPGGGYREFRNDRGDPEKKARTGIISSRYRLLVDQRAPFLYQLLHRTRHALAPKPEKIGGRTMKFRPLHDRVVVKRVEEEAKTKGGIIIPDTAKEKPMEGEIVAVGPGAPNEKGAIVPLDVKQGDRILFGKWSGSEIKLDGEDLLVMKESDVMGVIEGPSISITKNKAA